MVEVDLKALVGRLNRFCTRALEAAAGNCVSRTNYEVTVEHMFEALIEDPSADASQVLNKFNVDRARLIKTLKRDLDNLKIGNAGRPVFSPLLSQWFQSAWLISSINYKHDEIRGGTLLLALLLDGARLASGDFSNLLVSVLDIEQLQDNLPQIIADSSETDLSSVFRESSRSYAAGSEGEKLAAIDLYTTSVPKEVIPVQPDAPELIPGKVDEIAEALAKGNVLCVHTGHLGNHRYIQAFAARLSEGFVRGFGPATRIRQLNLALLVAGAHYKGEAEERAVRLFKELKRSVLPTVLFIDQIERVLYPSSNDTSGYLISDMTRTAITAREVLVVGFTDWEKYRRYFAQDRIYFSVVGLEAELHNHTRMEAST